MCVALNTYLCNMSSWKSHILYHPCLSKNHGGCEFTRCNVFELEPVLFRWGCCDGCLVKRISDFDDNNGRLINEVVF